MAQSAKPKTVAILEARTGAHLAGLISREGAVPLLAPALEEVPDVDPAAVARLLEDWGAQPFGMMIFQTGVGTRALGSLLLTVGKRGPACGATTATAMSVINASANFAFMISGALGTRPSAHGRPASCSGRLRWPWCGSDTRPDG